MSSVSPYPDEDRKPTIISKAGHIIFVMIVVWGTVKLGQTEIPRFWITVENELVYWIIIFGTVLESATFIRLLYLVFRANRIFKGLTLSKILESKSANEKNPQVLELDDNVIKHPEEKDLAFCFNQKLTRIDIFEPAKGKDQQVLDDDVPKPPKEKEPEEEIPSDSESCTCSTRSKFEDISQEMMAEINQ